MITITSFNDFFKSIKDINYNPELIIFENYDNVLTLIQSDGMNLKYFPLIYKSNPEIASAALLQNENSFKYIPSILKKNKKFLLDVISRNSAIISYINKKFVSSKKFMSECIRVNPRLLEWASDKIKNNRRIIKIALRHSIGRFNHIVQNLPESLQQNTSFLLELIKIDATILQDLLNRSNELADDIEFMYKAVKKNRESIKYLPIKATKDKRIMLEAVKSGANIYDYASTELKQDTDLIYKAIKYNAFALQFTMDIFNSDKRIILKAIETDGRALKYASPEFKKDKKMVLKAVESHGDALEFAPDLCDNRTIVLNAIITTPYSLKWASERLRADRDIVFEAVKKKGDALKYAAAELTNDKKLCLAAIKTSAYAVLYVSTELLKDEDIFLAVLEQETVMSLIYNSNFTNKNVVYNISLFLKNKDFVLKLISTYPHIYTLIPDNLLYDEDILLALIQHLSVNKPNYKKIHWILLGTPTQLIENNPKLLILIIKLIVGVYSEIELTLINRFKQMLLNYCDDQIDKYLLFWDLLKTSKMSTYSPVILTIQDINSFTYDITVSSMGGEQYILQNTTRDITFNTFSIKINKLHGFDNMSFIISGKVFDLENLNENVFDTFELLN